MARVYIKRFLDVSPEKQGKENMLFDGRILFPRAKLLSWGLVIVGLDSRALRAWVESLWENSNIPPKGTDLNDLVYEGDLFISGFWGTWGMFQKSVGIFLEEGFTFCLLKKETWFPVEIGFLSNSLKLFFKETPVFWPDAHNAASLTGSWVLPCLCLQP